MVSINIRRLLPITINCSNCSLTIDLPVDPESKQNSHIPPLVIIIVAILGGCFLLVSYYAIIVKYCSNWNRSRRPQVLNEQNLDAHEDFLDENHGPVVDHPIWYITTVGLEQGVIDSIAVFKYKKGDGLVEGTDCSVCLSEFQDDENLRLLPKCSHAFHISCIDTWLRSHTNCPSCRAPIVSSPVLPASTAVVGNSGVREEAQVENSASDGGVGSELNREGGVSDLSLGVQGERVEVERSRGIDVQKKDLPTPFKMSEFRVFSDLSDNHRVGENEIQPVRRSASMDFNPASILCFSVANSLPVEEEDEGSSIAPVERGKKLNSTPSLFRLIGSSSKGKLLPKSPVSMKRSFSSGNKLISSRHSRNRSSFIPL